MGPGAGEGRGSCPRSVGHGDRGAGRRSSVAGPGESGATGDGPRDAACVRGSPTTRCGAGVRWDRAKRKPSMDGCPSSHPKCKCQHIHTRAHPRRFALCHARGPRGVPSSFLPMTPLRRDPAAARSQAQCCPPDQPVRRPPLADLQSRGIELAFFTGGHVRPAAAFQGPSVTLGLYTCDHPFTGGKEPGAGAGGKRGARSGPRALCGLPVPRGLPLRKLPVLHGAALHPGGTSQSPHTPR